jgi:hypothetical protein
MKLKFRLMSVLTLAAIVTFTSCKKDDKNTTDYSSEVATHSDDQNRISTELDNVANEANVALESDAAFSGKMQDIQNINVICGASTVVDTLSNPRTITITYNGLNCSGTHMRTGTVILSMPAGVRWKNAGAVLTVTFQNFKIKRVSDNKSITINGIQHHTNVTGGLLFQLANLSNIIHTIQSSNMSITFDDNTQRTWQIARKRTFTYNNGIVLQIDGTHTAGTNSHIAEWGHNRFGHAFTTSVTQPLTFRQDCAGRLTSGELKHEGFATSVVKFGLDSTGNPTTCPGSGNYYYKITWTGPGGNSQTAIFPY